MATIYEVSKAAGVSVATVSRVINNSARVSQQTRDKVLAAMHALDYRPNAIARSLASRRTNSVGILVPELHGMFFGNLIAHIEDALRKAGKHVIVTVGHSRDDEEKEGVAFLSDRRVDGLILLAEAIRDEDLARLGRDPLPTLIMNRTVSGLEQNCISLDNEHGGYLATRALLQEGHRRIGYISGPMWKRDAEQRLAGHRRALREAGIDLDSRLCFEGDYRENSGREGFATLLAAGRRFTALAVANDDMAAGALSAARDHAMSVPRELSIVGFDNSMLAHYLYPRLTTIDFPVTAMGRTAAHWILQHAYGEDGPAIRHVFKPTLVMRESICPPPTGAEAGA
jgi:LacI family transcriptional regulator